MLKNDGRVLVTTTTKETLRTASPQNACPRKVCPREACPRTVWTTSRWAGGALLALVVSAAASGCDDKTEAPTAAPSATGSGASARPKIRVAPGAASAAAQAKQKADSVKALADTTSKPLTNDEYEALLLALSTCKVTEEGNIDSHCEALGKLQSARNAQTAGAGLMGMMGGLGKKHIKHESPAVRIQAASLMGSVFGADKDTQATIVKAIEEEKEPAVTAALVDVIGSKGADPDVGKTLLKMADHASPIVRKKALSWLSTSFSKDVPGRVEKLLEKMEKDPDAKTQAYACKIAGKTGDDKLIPAYEKLTADEKNPDLYGECMEGLLTTWNSYPFFDTSSEKGYKLFVKRLLDAPRSEKRPPWTIMSSIGYLGGDSDALKKWRATATWYKQDELVKAIGEVIKDEKANWLGRTGGVKALVGLKVDKKVLEALDKDCEKCNSNVQKAIKEAVAGAK